MAWLLTIPLRTLGRGSCCENLPKIASGYAERRAACMRAAKAYDWPGVCQKYSELYDAATGATVRTILDVPVQVQTFDDAVERIDARFAKGEQLAIAFANAHTLNVASRECRVSPGASEFTGLQ